MQLDGGFLRGTQTAPRCGGSRRREQTGEDEIANIWAAREREAPAPKAYTKGFAKLLRKLGCAAGGSPHVRTALISRISRANKSNRAVYVIVCRITK